MLNSWDKRYKSKEYIYGEKPNSFLKEFLDNSIPGKLMLPGDGEGRNSVYAATRGWDITAFDSSKMAKEKALMLANKNNVKVNYINTDVATFASKDKFDVISIIYLHLPFPLRNQFHRNLKNLLNKNGTILLECFSKLQINNSSGGPPTADLLYSKQELENDFSEYNIELIEETEAVLDEGRLHQGKADVVRLIAKNTS